MNDAYRVYDNPLIGRYASREMAERWGPQRKFQTWRRLWLALAETEAELGLTTDDGVTPRIQPAQLEALAKHLDDIDFAAADQYENKLRHDVMAHIHALGDVCPEARDIVHLGATSCYVTDNTDLILMREGLDQLILTLANVIDALARFAEQWRNEPTLGFTHFQPAQLTTVGKRATLWAYEFVLDLQELENRRNQLPFRGTKGTTGTQASFLALFHGDHAKVRELDRRVSEKMGFSRTFPVTGQTYSRKIDSQIVESLAGIGQSASKWGCDLRLLAHRQEIDEPFGSNQIGSSAMAYKRNPMRAERMCGLSRYLMGLPAIAAETAATQWFERTLDDSSTRRLVIPQAFLAADAVLRLALNLARGLIVNTPIIAKGVAEAIPYMATENLLMAAVAQGGDRQELHEIIRMHSRDVTLSIKAGQGSSLDLLTKLQAEPSFQQVDFAKVVNPHDFIGRSPEQVLEFIDAEIQPIRERYAQHLNQQAEVRV
ncbi:adenylosuccinate lyase [Tuwongella immobilis]|uniref:Adenylosuccinate lyase n=1 Tax=Tuwongella immobilis TaxID=692036 RepID=A0A6C2YJ06_9BACT|nr:adenylosuccinate lyase [Tuwongella immobilis]VIP01387.1 adenylosuccinate lyase : Adenylosuccinate lyase OS=uncultured planctomycete GN=HGMM_F33C03C06 PE=3 SV=1: Lyase_1: ADSL_C [Tuwongella immobilis]VTR98254.1 adenylosuccinate lyase : Adenylosuccinate lyase OS=uncultured planctomycete GN=HGMM_F33C03C06 PE=3 SV=1: Lyase_1: ADSL_C [Tuwongella immobilis]